MKLSLQNGDPTTLKGCLMIGIFSDASLSPAAKKIDKMHQGIISKALKEKVFEGKRGQILPLFLNESFETGLLLVGCGTENDFTMSHYRNIIFKAFKCAINLNAKRVVCYLSDLAVKEKPLAAKIKQLGLIIHESFYQFDLFKTKKESPSKLDEIIIYLPDSKEFSNCEKALYQGTAMALGSTITKNLANLPSNICTPTFLAEQAKSLSKEYKSLSVKILDEKEMQKLKMGALLAVSQGSSEEAKLICLEYKGTTKKMAPIALVGKGITFDTGGNSLKTPDNMVGMKYDMCGAATVLGTLKAIAELKLPLHVIGVIPAVENMPGGTAYKPEDILTSLSGQTIEVISTDAEGRLILADALTYCERYKPEVVIDIATLTGAIVIALGHHATGMMSNDEPLAKHLLKAGEEIHDRVWQLPLWDDYQEQIKSPFADMANVGGRAAGSITAGCFLSRFTKKFQWAHLDVAGTAAMMMGTNERMATGRPVPLLVQYLIDRSS